MSVTLEDVLSAARVQAASVTGETAGYLLLGLLDQVGGVAGRLDASAAHLAEDGSVSVARLGDGNAVELEADLRAFLGSLLASCRGATPALLRIGRTAESRGLLHVIAELEAALIPVNRAAGRRALCRVHRDTTRAKDSGKLASAKPAERVVAPAPPSKTEATVVAPPPLPVAAPPAPPAAAPARTARPVAPEVPPPRVPLAPAEVAVFRPPSPPAARILLSPPAPPAALLPEPTPIVGIEPVPAERQILATEPLEPEATPFLGAWPGALPVVTALKEVPEHDTQLLPPVLPAWANALESARAPEGEVAARSTDAAAPSTEPVVIASSDGSDGPPSEPVVVVPVENAELVPPAVFTVVAPPIVPLAPRVLGPKRDVTVERSTSDTVEMLALAEMESSSTPPEVDEFAVLATESIPDLSVPAPLAVPIDAALELAPAAIEEGDEESSEDEAAVDESMLEPESHEAAHDALAFGADHAQSPVAPLAEIADSPDAPVVEPAESPEPPAVSATYKPRQSDVSDLLATFAVAESRSLREISRDLKNLAGIAGTPCPPAVALKR